MGWVVSTLAITKLKSHWVMRAAAMVKDRMWLGCAVLAMALLLIQFWRGRLTAHSALKTNGIGPHPKE